MWKPFSMHRQHARLMRNSLDQAAARGLHEELGIEVEEQRLAEPLVKPHLRQLHAPEVGVLDCEFVTSFRWAPVLARRSFHLAGLSKPARGRWRS